MTLQEIFQHLSSGELVQISLGSTGIPAEHQERVLSSINLGLTELHKRFLLKEGRIDILLQPNKTTYVLDKRYAASNGESLEPVKYLQDSVDLPFRNELLKIERVYDSAGSELGLNTGGIGQELTSQTCRTPAFNILVLPAGLSGSTVTAVYRANHPIIRKEDNFFDPAEVEVDLPYSHLEALLYYVASRIMNPIGMVNEYHDGNNFMAKFEQACLVLDHQNYQVDSMECNDRLARNGWV